MWRSIVNLRRAYCESVRSFVQECGSTPKTRIAVHAWIAALLLLKDLQGNGADATGPSSAEFSVPAGTVRQIRRLVATLGGLFWGTRVALLSAAYSTLPAASIGRDGQTSTSCGAFARRSAI
jgi:hypothetical protein